MKIRMLLLMGVGVSAMTMSALAGAATGLQAKTARAKQRMATITAQAQHTLLVSARTGADTARYINECTDPGLNEFGLGVVTSADVARFAQSPIVLTRDKVTPVGIVFRVLPGWSWDDAEKERQLFAIAAQMVQSSK